MSNLIEQAKDILLNKLEEVNLIDWEARSKLPDSVKKRISKIKLNMSGGLVDVDYRTEGKGVEKVTFKPTGSASAWTGRSAWKLSNDAISTFKSAGMFEIAVEVEEKKPKVTVYFKV